MRQFRARLKSLKKKTENYNNTEFTLFPTVNEPPTVEIGLLDSFQQYTWVDHVSEGEYTAYKNIQQTTNKIIMLEGTSFSFSPTVKDTNNIVDVNNINNVYFYWTKNGAPLYDINNQNKLKGARSLLITQASTEMSGIYRLDLTNKIGITQSDVVEIDVINKENYPLFYKNLIINPNASRGLEGWVADNNFTTQHFSNDAYEPFHRSIPRIVYQQTQKSLVDRVYILPFHFQISDNQVNLKQWFSSTPTLNITNPADGWAIWRLPNFHPMLVASEDPNNNNKPGGGFFPAPSYIDKANKNTKYSLANIIIESKRYFTRDKIKFTIYGGKATSVAYQDVDISQVAQMVDGQAYGVDRLYAHFFAYIGAGISRYKTKYVTKSNEYFEDNTIPLNSVQYDSGSRANEVNNENVKPPLIPFLDSDDANLYTDIDMETLFSTLSTKDLDTGLPSFKYIQKSDGSYPQPRNNPDIDINSTGLANYVDRIYKSGYWFGIVVGNDNKYQSLTPTTWRLWYARLDNRQITTPDGLRVRRVKVPQWYTPPQINYSAYNTRVKNKTALRLNTTEPFVIEPVLDDETDVRLDFLDQNQNIIASEIINGPTAKDIWAVKEKFFVPFYIANMYHWVTDLTTQQIKIFDKVYTTINSVKAVDDGNGPMDLHAGWIKAYHYRLWNEVLKTQIATTPVIGIDSGAAAMFGINKDVVIPPKTRTIRVNIIFNHKSNVLFDSNPRLKGWTKQDIYYDYLTQYDADKRFYEYGNPRCGLTAMHLSLHPSKVEVSEKTNTYKIPPGNVWYKHKRVLESDDISAYNSIGAVGNLQTNIDNIELLQYRYGLEADDATTAFTDPSENLSEYELNELLLSSELLPRSTVLEANASTSQPLTSDSEDESVEAGEDGIADIPQDEEDTELLNESDVDPEGN